MITQEMALAAYYGAWDNMFIGLFIFGALLLGADLLFRYLMKR